MEYVAKKKANAKKIRTIVRKPIFAGETIFIKSPTPDPKAREKMIAFLKDLLRKLGEKV